MFGVEVYEDGVLTHSYGDTEENLHDVYSVTKSILSIAFGIAWDRGLMLYNGGVYEGKRILSEEYIRMATSIQQACREGGYGYFFWRYRDGFSINGRLKQKCYILPSRKLIVTYLSEIEDTSPALKDSMEAHIMGL